MIYLDDDLLVVGLIWGKGNNLCQPILKVITKGNTSEDFAKVQISFNGTKKTKESARVRGYLSAVDKTVHFGLGDTKIIDTIKVYWPSGKYQEIFNLSKPVFANSTPQPSPPLFPDVSYVLENYSAMTDLKEFMDEVIPFLKFKNTKNGLQIRMFNENKEYGKHTPIFMVDGWMMPSQEAVLNIPINEIEQIDIFRTTQTLRSHFNILGNNGVLSFNSKNGNLGQKLAKETNILTSHAISPPQNFSTPKIEKPHLPDFRPLIYWNPSVYLNNGMARIEFNHSDDIGEFVILVRGLNENGEVKSSILEYNVK